MISSKVICGIYKITGPKGKCYIGQSVNIFNRFRFHYFFLNKGTHGNPKLQNAWNKYGGEKFHFGILLRCSESELVSKEQEMMDLYDSVKNGYNVYPSSRQSNRGIKNPGLAKRNRENTGSKHPSYGKPRPDLAEWNRSNTPKGKNNSHYKKNPLRKHDKEILEMLKSGKSLYYTAKIFKTSISCIRNIKKYNPD